VANSIGLEWRFAPARASKLLPVPVRQGDKRILDILLQSSQPIG
jgi:hypothetical protein